MEARVCLSCARLETDGAQARCKKCGCPLWLPHDVGGKPGNTDIEEAVDLILAGKIPWLKSEPL